VDFFAIYIIPTDDWYIIPYEVVGDRDANLYFRPGVRGHKYGEYREAWYLLVNACKAGREGPIDIQACCDEGGAEQTEGNGLISPEGSWSALRYMFRGNIWSSGRLPTIKVGKEDSR
jgi:hypothetical protein